MSKITVQTIALSLCLFSSAQAAPILEQPSDRKLALGISLGYGGFGLSVFDINRFMEYSATSYSYESSNLGKDDYEGADTHLHVRRFFKPQNGGWYYGAFLHRTRLNGLLKDKHKNAEQSKTGVGLEFGYTASRLLKTKRLYWGAGLGISRYIGAKETDIFKENDLKNDSDVGYFLDFIRIGAVF